MKNVVYLVGAGATQAEADYQGGELVNLMMKDSERLGPGISTRILRRANIDRDMEIQEADIEKLISLFSASGIEEYRALAEKLRGLYYKEILNTLSKAAIIETPELAIGLLDMHKNETFKNVENLTGIISLNHDNLFQIASQKIYDCVNLGFEFDSNHFKYDENCTIPYIIQLHGSFNWRNSLPIEVLKLSSKSKYDKEILWIPPAILKETKDYPYNKLMALAYELLTKKCNILRIIGCSLSQNDWNLISLIFNAQYYQYHFIDNKSCFKIELIMNHDTGESIRKDYSYFKNLTPIGYLKDGEFSAYKDKTRRSPRRSPEMENPFKYWLKTKAQYHIKRKEIDIDGMGEALRTII